MKLLDELRNLDVGNPGLWSARVSVALACSLFALMVVLGLRVRVFGQLTPRLDAAKAEAASLQQQLAAARNEAGATRAIGREAEQAEERLKAAAVWIPPQAQELDLPAALAAGRERAPLQAVRSWEPPADPARRLRPAGAELDLSGSYAELAAFLDRALDSMQLRELIELSIESTGPDEPDRLRATVWLAAYFGGVGAERLLRAMPKNWKSLHAEDYARRLAGRPSPFASPLALTGDHMETQMEAPPAAFPARGVVRVGSQRYNIVQDAEGKLRLRAEKR